MRHVLIVDDALDLGKLLKATLALLDPSMPIVVVPSGEEAILESSRYPLDLLVTDLRLPGISGIELIKRVRNKHPGVKVIMITGMTDDNVLQQAHEVNVDAFFNKPMSIPEFTEAARHCLGIGGPALVLPGVSKEAEKAPPSNTSSEGDRMADVLGGLRHRLAARSVILLDNNAHLVAQIGEAMDRDFEDQWIPVLVAAINASMKVSRVLGQAIPANVLACRGEKYNLVFCPVGIHSLIIVLDAERSYLRQALAFEEAYLVQAELQLILKDMGLALEPSLSASMESAMPIQDESQPLAEPEVEVDLDSFAALFEKPSEDLVASNADQFWDANLPLKALESLDADVLSYEEARRLGLAPEDSAA